MKGIKLFTPPLASLLLLAACGETDDAEHRTTPIGFSTRVTETGTTRAEEITTANLTSMGILASFTGQTNFDGANVTPGFMYNQPVTKNGTTWTYTPLKYWPNNPEDKVSFFAYAPYNATGVTLSGADHTGYPYLTYEVPAAEANQTDLLASLPLLDKNGENLTFTMKHALTKVNIIVKDGESDDTPQSTEQLHPESKIARQTDLHDKRVQLEHERLTDHHIHHHPKQFQRSERKHYHHRHPLPYSRQDGCHILYGIHRARHYRDRRNPPPLCTL